MCDDQRRLSYQYFENMEIRSIIDKKITDISIGKIAEISFADVENLD